MNSNRPRTKANQLLATARGISVLLTLLAASSCGAPSGGGVLTAPTAPVGGGPLAIVTAEADTTQDDDALAIVTAEAIASRGGGAIENKGAIAPQTGAAVQMSKTDVLPAGDSFIYTFQAAQGITATIELRQRDGTLDPYLRLLDPDGQEIAADDDSGGDRDSLIRLQLETAGTYTIVVRSYNDASGGRFSLTVSLE
jgi:hypothetical protein